MPRRDSAAPVPAVESRDPEWMDELPPDERELARDPSAVDVDGDAALRWLETGEGPDPWARAT